jgi:superfamily II DNA/RNA helicase
MIEEFAAETERKVIMFSEWTGMLNLVEPLLNKFKANFVRLDGSVPQKMRQGLVHEFQHNPECTFFITTNAGATGLNLQAANTVVNVDLPWNPAVLDQRIGRAHRMGQKRPVQVYLLVTENTLEENLLATLSAKKDLALTVLDPNATVSEITMASGIEELKKRMEVLLGEKPEAPLGMSTQAKVRNEAMAYARREQVSLAGGQLLGATFDFIGALFPAQVESEHSDQVARMLKASLSEGMERDPDGRLLMKIALPNEEALDALASSLARVVASGLHMNHGVPSPTV